jgi:hypothetical protein
MLKHNAPQKKTSILLKKTPTALKKLVQDSPFTFTEHQEKFRRHSLLSGPEDPFIDEHDSHKPTVRNITHGSNIRGRIQKFPD